METGWIVSLIRQPSKPLDYMTIDGWDITLGGYCKL